MRGVLPVIGRTEEEEDVALLSTMVIVDLSGRPLPKLDQINGKKELIPSY
ncbi:hypothetical protein [Peribacillus asahii]